MDTQPTPDAWQRSIVQYLAGHPDRPLKLRALARELRVAPSDYTTFRTLVRQLLDAGILMLGAGRTIRLPGAGGTIVGTFRAHPRGFGFIERPGQPAVYVDAERTGGALDGDTVTARMLKQHGLGPRGEITRITERAERHWVGILERVGTTWLVRPQGRAALPPVYISDPTAKAARAGDLVVVEPLEETLNRERVRGVIVERLGDPSAARTCILGVIRRHGLPDDFPPAVRQAARQAAKAFEPEAAAGRRDLRDLLTVTIDPVDARDYDDAISVETLADGRTRLGVHIADVAHFVPPGSPIDLEAQRRGTSTYFPGFVVPMLPEVLSNGVCSLQPGEPRLTKTVFITYDHLAHVLDTDIGSSVIRSAARLTYEQVTAALETGPAQVAPQVLELLKRAEDLARRIRQRRLRDGMLVLNLPDVEIQLDDQGEVVSAGPADTSFSHTIIEMFMVEANEAISRALTQARLEHLRRVHPEPAEDEAAGLRCLTPILGRRPPKVLDRGSLGRLLDTVRGGPSEPVVNFVLLRSLPQAYYSAAPDGHFALASEDYCHFTSPIRRYPDLTVHRLIELLDRPVGGRKARRRAEPVLSDAELADLGRRMSAAERRAQQAERDAKALLLARLMKTKLGEEFDGLVSGVAAIGAFVQIRPYLAEGLVRVADFGPDEWAYDRDTGVFTGRRTQRRVHLGQAVRVRVAAVDEARSEIAFVPAGGGLFGVPPEIRGARARERRRKR